MKVHWTMERSPVVTSRIKSCSFLTLCSPHIAGEGELRGFKRESEPRERERVLYTLDRGREKDEEEK